MSAEDRRLTSWFKQNQTLLIFLIAQAVAIATAGASIIAYYVRMETRIDTMETRGAAYTVGRMDEMKQRITVLEEQVSKNEESIKRVVDVMTRELGKK
jgi:hypothetical protein